MKLPLLVLFVVALASAGVSPAQEVKGVPLPANHPLLGTWRIELPNKCVEEYTLRADGTTLSSSGRERNESVFEISESPLPSGFYRWSERLVKSNGRRDCGGAVAEVGHVAVHFVRLHPSGTRFQLCETEAASSCFAELYRRGRDT
jgi:hypothetical protein